MLTSSKSVPACEGDENSSKMIKFLLNNEQIELEMLLEATLEVCTVSRDTRTVQTSFRILHLLLH